jgi:hypothetical protein
VDGDPVNGVDPSGLLIGGILGSIWAGPSSAIGLLYAVPGVLLGGDLSVRWDEDAGFIAEVRGHPIHRWQQENIPGAGAAVTLGHYIIYASDSPDPSEQLHERAHVCQSNVLGPFFIPANVGGGLTSLATTGDWWDDNPLEWGPMMDAPRPFL